MSAAKEKKITGSKRVKRESDGVADWASVNGELLAAVIGIVAKNGGALRFGYTRDGGAYSVGIYGDGEKPYTDYIRPTEDVEQYLRDLGERWYNG
jgi:hypothetical protein